MGMFVNVMRRENWIPYVSPSSLLYASVSAASEGGKNAPPGLYIRSRDRPVPSTPYPTALRSWSAWMER